MLLAVFEIWLYVAAERLSSKMPNRLSDVVRSRQQKTVRVKRQCGHGLGYPSMQNVLFTSYETAICSRSHVCRAALPTTFQKATFKAHAGSSI